MPPLTEQHHNAPKADVTEVRESLPIHVLEVVNDSSLLRQMQRCAETNCFRIQINPKDLFLNRGK